MPGHSGAGATPRWGRLGVTARGPRSPGPLRFGAWTSPPQQPPPSPNGPASTGTTSPWCWAPAGGPRPTSSARPSASSPMAELPGFRPADGRGARRHDPLGARRRAPGAGAARPHPPVRGARRRAGGARGAHGRGRGLPHGRAHQRRGRHPAGDVGRRAGADRRPPQPDGDLPARRRAASSTSPTSTRPPCAPAPGRSTRRSPKASTRACPGRTSRPPPRSGCCAGWARTWSACRPCWKPSPRAPQGLEVFGLSLVTNLAAGITGAPLDHQEVLAAGAASAGRMGGAPAGAACADRRHCRDAARHRAGSPTTPTPRRATSSPACWRARWRAPPAPRTTSPTAWRARCASARPGCAGRCGRGRRG